MNKIKLLLAGLVTTLNFNLQAQNVEWTPEQIKTFSQEYKGPRSADGRPKVPDDLVKRLKNISIEEAWGYLKNKGYNSQFDAGWTTFGGEVIAGRVLSAQYMPSRPDIDEPIKAKGAEEKRSGSPNSWPIDLLTQGDVYVADGYGKIIDGTLIGDNLGNAIFAKSGNGVIFDGSIRDIEGLEEIEGFVGFVRGMDPSYIRDMMLTCINCPIRIGRATVMPGDLVLGKKEGVIFIPAYLAADLIKNAEFVALRDEFGHLRLREGKYTPGEVDRKWTDNIKEDFLQWIKAHPEKLQMSVKEFDEYTKDRNW